MIDWLKYGYFKEYEFKCSHTGKADVKVELLDKLSEVRTMLNKPMVITSGFRDVTHPIEAAKIEAGRPRGVHTMGIAVDVACNGQLCYEIIRYATMVGFTGIGVSQSGSSRFLHLDLLEGAHTPRPNIWSY